MNFSPCDITVSSPLRSRYSLSAARRRNLGESQNGSASRRLHPDRCSIFVARFPAAGTLGPPRSPRPTHRSGSVSSVVETTGTIVHHRDHARSPSPVTIPSPSSGGSCGVLASSHPGREVVSHSQPHQLFSFALIPLGAIEQLRTDPSSWRRDFPSHQSRPDDPLKESSVFIITSRFSSTRCNLLLEDCERRH